MKTPPRFYLSLGIENPEGFLKLLSESPFGVVIFWNGCAEQHVTERVSGPAHVCHFSLLADVNIRAMRESYAALRPREPLHGSL